MMMILISMTRPIGTMTEHDRCGSRITAHSQAKPRHSTLLLSTSSAPMLTTLRRVSIQI